MTGTINKLFHKEAASFLLGTAALVAPSLSAGHTPDLPVHADDTIIYKVLSHSINTATGDTSLTVDASSMKERIWAIMIDKVTKAAIMMPNTDRKDCPFIDLSRYNTRIDQMLPKSYEFNFRATVSPEDARRVNDAKCLVINIPSTRTINWKEKPSL